MGPDSQVPSRHPLVAARMMLGFSQAQLLARILDHSRRRGVGLATNRSTLSRWEHGHQTPDRDAQLCIADTFGVAASEIDRQAWPDWLPRGDSAVLNLEWTTSGALTALSHAATQTSMDACGFPIAKGPVLVGLVARALIPPGPGLPAQPPRPLPPAWQAHQQQAHEFSYLYRAHGGQRLHGLVHESLRHQEELLATDPEGNTPEQFAIAAAMTEIAGWVDFDCMHYASAQVLLITALRAAQAARQNSRLHSTAVALAMQALHTDSLRAAHDILSLVHDAVGPAATPRTRALIRADLGRAQARLGNAQDTVNQLDLAATAYAEATDIDDDPDWSADIDEVALEGHRGIALLDLGRPTESLPSLIRAVDGRRHTHARERTSYTILLARAHHLDGQPAEARQALSDARRLLTITVASPRLRAAAEGVGRLLS